MKNVEKNIYIEKLEIAILMKKVNFKKLYKRLLILVFMIYVIYTFVMQQQTLNAYKIEENKYNQEIEAKQDKLTSIKNNVNSNEYIEQIAREKLNMYLPNERVYIDIGK